MEVDFYAVEIHYVYNDFQTPGKWGSVQLQMKEAGFLGIPTKMAFGIGATAEAAIHIGFNAFNFFFYNQILGLSGTYAGLAVTIALIFDAITDPLVGALSDRFKSRWGRRHPFMFVAAAPVAIFFYFIYTPPVALEDFSLFLWFTVFTVLLRSSLTLFTVPHLALGAELSTDYNERSKVMSYNSFFAWIGGAGTHFIGMLVFFAATAQFSYGLLNKDAYPDFALFVAITAFLCMLASGWYTRDRIPTLSQPPAELPGFHLKDTLKDMWGALKNRNYLALMFGLFFLSAFFGTRETLNNHVSTYFWEFKSEEIVWYSLSSLIGFLLAFILTARYHEKFDKRPTILVSVACLCISAALPIICRGIGFFPENHSPYLLPLVLFMAVFYYHCLAVLTISVMSALADIVDEHELTTGRRQEGVFYAARTFFTKSVSGLGHLVAGIFIDFIAFPTSAVPGTVDPDKVFWLGMMDGPIAAVPGIIAIFFYGRYAINKSVHEKIQAELRERRANRIPLAANK